MEKYHDSGMALFRDGGIRPQLGGRTLFTVQCRIRNLGPIGRWDRHYETAEPIAKPWPGTVAAGLVDCNCCLEERAAAGRRAIVRFPTRVGLDME